MSAQRGESNLQVTNPYCFFSNNFYKVLSNKLDGNIATSPFSLHIILSLLHHGSKGITANELQTVLYPSSTNVSHDEIKSLFSILNNIKDVQLQIANAIYVQSGFQVLSEYITVSTDVFNCNVSITDFGKSTEAVDEINSWIKTTTKDKISNVLTADDVNDSTVVVLVNVVYFKGHWLHKFDNRLTEKKSFHMTKTEKKSVPMMFKKSKFVHGEIPHLNARFIEIPYLNEDITMTILLPDEIDGLKFVESNFKWEDLPNTSHIETEVELYLPRFKYEVTVDLKNTLNMMGLHSMFEDTADFGNLTDASVRVSKVLQKVFIEVNEEGSEAAAATVAMIRLRRALIDLHEQFIVDRPFLFIIRYKPSKIPLFLGSVKDIHVPTEKDEL